MKRRICVRSMFLGAAIMLIGLAVGTIVSPPLGAQRNGVFDEIQCTKLTVVDNMGKPAVRLGSYENWGNGVIVYNKQGKGAVRLRSNALGNGVVVYNKQEEPSVVLASDEESNVIAIVDFVRTSQNMGKSAVVLGSDEESNEVVVYNRQGKEAVKLRSSELGNAVSLSNKQEEPSVVLVCSEDLGNKVIVANKQRNSTVVELGSTEYGGQVDFYNNQGERRAMMGVNKYGYGVVDTWDKNGYRQ